MIPKPYQAHCPQCAVYNHSRVALAERNQYSSQCLGSLNSWERVLGQHQHPLGKHPLAFQAFLHIFL